MAHDIFISYSSKDKIIADAVVSRMESGGIRCWYAPRDIVPGSDWAESITNAISASKILVLIFTQNSNLSIQVLREVAQAVEDGATVIPMRMENIEPGDVMKGYLEGTHWLDAVDEKLESSVDDLYTLCAAVLETINAQSGEGSRKRFTVKKAIILSVLAAVLFFGGRFVLRMLRLSGAIRLRDYEPLGAASPIGELSPGYGTEPFFAEGTAPGNIRTGGYIAYSDGWYYFRSNDDEKLYKMREDGSEAKKLSDHSAKFIFVHDGWVYFEEEHGYVGIYRVTTEGENEQMIYGSDVPYMSLIGDRLYYFDYFDGLSFIDLTLDPEEIEFSGQSVCKDEDLCDSMFEMCFDGECIYYTTTKVNGLYRLNIADGKSEKIVRDMVTGIVLYDRYICFNDLTDGSIKAYDLSSDKILTLVPFMMDYYQVRNDGIYGNSSNDGYLVKFDPSTGTTYQLSDKQVTYVCLANERLFFWDFNRFYSTDLNGKSLIAL
ncbi:MAG: DUF5050 domain-containing protein [Oscillospiraceae bacterium]|nr:DUF5050 domain-containing protein [Oscillospiraceae bacterium]